MSDLKDKITSKTLVPISLVISLIGGGGWLTQIYSTTEATAKTLAEVRHDLKELREDHVGYKIENNDKIYRALVNIEKRLTAIETKL